jgi:hypothetical protein
MCVFLSSVSLFVSLTRSLRDYVFVLQVTLCRLRGHPRHWLMAMAVHEVECGVMYRDMSNSMKSLEEQEYCDVSK